MPYSWSFAVIVCLSSLCLETIQSVEEYSPDLEIDRKKATLVYSKIIPCLLKNRSASIDSAAWKYPEDAHTHYQDLLKSTEKFRGFGPQRWSGYSGPWIENYFIDHFMKKPLRSFSGLIPLFGQWVDMHVNEFLHKRDHIPKYSQIYEVLEKVLRKDVLYVAVSQDDEGLFRLTDIFPNIIVLSAGGYGHIPIPLLKEEIDMADKQLRFKYDVGFYGQDDTHLIRKGILHTLRSVSQEAGLTVHSAKSSAWQDLVKETRFNLAPRGFGRTSFRAAEIIHLSSCVVYLYNDVPWMPYEGTDIDYRHIGLVARSDNLSSLIDSMKTLKANVSLLDELLTRTRAARKFYTYVGVIKEMERFFDDPFGPKGGHLRCAGLPPTIK